jgi:hypothetical protein
MAPLGLGSSLSRASVILSTSLILDKYTGAVAAYSLRSLKSGVTSVVKVRRAILQLLKLLMALLLHGQGVTMVL